MAGSVNHYGLGNGIAAPETNKNDMNIEQMRILAMLLGLVGRGVMGQQGGGLGGMMGLGQQGGDNTEGNYRVEVETGIVFDPNTGAAHSRVGKDGVLRPFNDPGEQGTDIFNLGGNKKATDKAMSKRVRSFNNGKTKTVPLSEFISKGG